MLKKRVCFIFFILFISLMVLSIPPAQSQEEPYDSLLDQSVIAYLYPLELKKGDIISDGPHGPQYKIRSDTLFIWVDLMPDADFAHPTKYIFIRDHEKWPVLVRDGEWWPYLNEHPILYGSPNKSALVSPYQLDSILVYLYPLELKEGDVVSDGEQGHSFKIKCDTLFIWIDLIPNAFFVHPTKYVFIRGMLKKPVRVADGEWWPCLNGSPILHFNTNLGALISPFRLSRPPWSP